MVRLRVIIPLFFLTIHVLADTYDTIKINEFMASNIYSQLNPEKSDFVDWIEFYNSGNQSVQLNDTYLTDDLSNPQKWRMPENAMIESNSFLIIWADGLEMDYHANFKLSEDGEQIGLFRADGTPIDTLTYSPQLNDISYGRYPDGGNSWQYFDTPTCGLSNTTNGLVSKNQASMPTFSHAGGHYSGGVSVTISGDNQATLFYTVDGSLPTSVSKQYQSPIFIDTTTTLRARAYQNGLLASTITTRTYIIDEPSKFPVICLSTPPEFLFDKNIGITVGIPVSDSLGAPPPFDPNANFWHKWERPVYIELYEPDGDCGLSQDAGIKIFGGLFGRQIRQKAFTLFARDKYGDTDFDYPLFPTKSISAFKRFILRCSSNDFNRTYLRDAMMNTLVINQMDVDYQAYQPAMVYINGMFWGMYNIREKTNEFYPESNYGIDKDDVDLIEGMGDTAYGDGTHYQNLIEFVKNNDMGLPVNYTYVKTMMDMDEFMNYFITELYVRNHDWLRQNIKCWREHKLGGRWRWLLYDTDWGFNGEIMEGEEQYKTNSIQWALNLDEASILFQRLIQNTTFKNEFAQRFATHLNITFSPMRVNRMIDSLAQNIAPEMPRQIDRWGAIRSMEYWEDQLRVLHEFANERPQYVFQHLRESLSLDEQTDVVVEVSDSSSGWIAIHDAPVPAPSFSGLWFKNIPIRLKANPVYGYRFVRWEGTYASGKDTLSFVLQDSTSLKAVFESVSMPSIVINEIHYNPSADLQGDDDDYEFIELLNCGNATVDISGYQFTSGIQFTFPAGIVIKANETLLLAKKASTYSDENIQVFQFTSGKLDNAGETLCLKDSLGIIVDSLTYDDNPPWPTQADGDGYSLELKDPKLDNGLASSWKSSSKIGGTPGTANSTNVKDLYQPFEYALCPASPNPFNPETHITFSMAHTGNVILDIYNLRGERIHTLMNAKMDAGKHTIMWNAASESSGVYFIRMQTDHFRQIRKCLLIK